MTATYQFNLPTRVEACVGAVDQLPDIISGFGKRALVVVPGDVPSLTDPILAKLDASDTEITSLSLEPGEPTIDFIDAAARQFRDHDAQFDVIVGIGGGSAIDVAKSMAIALCHTESIWMYANLSDRPPLPLTAEPLPVIAVATTSGTGSEVTPYAVLTKTDTQQKGTIQEPAIFPKVAILDPALITGLPAHITASTGLDAFAHALEATINISKPTPAAEMFGIAAMRKIFAWLPIAYAEPDNLEARLEMSWASTLAGMAISHRGTTTAHAIAEPLGAITHIPHGLGVSLATLPVLRHSLNRPGPNAASALARLNIDVLGADSHTSEQSQADDFLGALGGLFQSVDMVQPASTYLSEDQMPDLSDRLVESIMKFKFRPLKQHPVEFGAEELKPIVEEMIFGDQVRRRA